MVSVADPPKVVQYVVTLEHVLGVAATPLAAFLLALASSFPAQAAEFNAAAALVQAFGTMTLLHAPAVKVPLPTFSAIAALLLCAAIGAPHLAACTPAQVQTAENVDRTIQGLACSPLDPLDSVGGVRFACDVLSTVETGIQTVTVAVSASKAGAFAAAHPRVTDAGLSGALVKTVDGSIVLSDAPIALPPTWLPSAPGFLDAAVTQ